MKLKLQVSGYESQRVVLIIHKLIIFLNSFTGDFTVHWDAARLGWEPTPGKTPKQNEGTNILR